MTVSFDSSSGMNLTFQPATKKDDALQHLFIVIRTVLGDCPMYRSFGIDNSYLHLPSVVAKTVLASAIVDAVEKFVPEVSLEDIRFGNNSDSPDMLYPIMEVTFNE